MNSKKSKKKAKIRSMLPEVRKAFLQYKKKASHGFASKNYQTSINSIYAMNNLLPKKYRLKKRELDSLKNLYPPNKRLMDRLAYQRKLNLHIWTLLTEIENRIAEFRDVYWRKVP